jgi:hypothetical protein
MRLGREPSLDLLLTCNREETLQGFQEVSPRFFHRVTLTDNIQLGANRNKPVVFTLDESGQFHRSSHSMAPPSPFYCRPIADCRPNPA